MTTKTLSPELLQKMDAYWRAANYLSVGQIYLYDNPLLKRPLTLADVKHMLLLGHDLPGQNFIYVHLNRVIKKYDLNIIVSGPGPDSARPHHEAALIHEAMAAALDATGVRLCADFWVNGPS